MESRKNCQTAINGEEQPIVEETCKPESETNSQPRNINSDVSPKGEESPKAERNTRFNPDDYTMMMEIGRGNFSELLMVEHKTTKVLYCMKMFTKQRVEQLKKQEDVLMEKHVMEKVPPHEYLIGYKGSYKDDMFLYILYEYVNGGELWKKSVCYGLHSVDLIRYYFIQVLKGIKHLHDHGILHRDIKVGVFTLA